MMNSSELSMTPSVRFVRFSNTLAETIGTVLVPVGVARGGAALSAEV